MSGTVKLGQFVKASTKKNKELVCTDVYSVTNSAGFVPSTEFFSKEVFSSELSGYKLVDSGAIAYNPSRINVGSVAVQDKCEMAIVSPLYVVFKVDEHALLPEYVCRFLKSGPGQAQIAFRSSGTVRNNLKFDALCEMTIPLPSLEEQASEMSVLSSVEQQVDLLRLWQTKLDELVKSRFVEMFESGQEWELRTLAECCASPDDIKCGPFGSQLHKEDYISEGVPVWGIPEVNSGFEKLPDKYVSPENAQRLQSYALIPGDVAMNRKGNVGQAALFDGAQPSGIIHSDVLRVRARQDVLEPSFLVEQLHSSHVVREQVMSASTGAIMAGTNVTKLKKIKVFVPPLVLQQEFAAFVQQVDKLKSETQQAIEKLQMLYDSLAQEYFGS